MSWRSTSGTSSTERPSSKSKRSVMAWVSCGQSAIALNKVSLSPFDSKRWIAKNGVDTLAYGHRDAVLAGRRGVDWRVVQRLRTPSGGICVHRKQLFSNKASLWGSLRQSSKELRSLQWNKQTQRVCSRMSYKTELYFCVRTQTDCSAWRPEKASKDSISFFFVNAVKAEQSSMIYNVGSPINTW